MVDDYKKKINDNNEIILRLKKEYNEAFKENVQNNDYSYTDDASLEKLKEINEKQLKEINNLNMLLDAKYQNAKFKNIDKIEKLKEKETDSIFSDYYRNGVIEINGIEVSVNKFFIKEVEYNGRLVFNFVCSDKRIDNNILGTINDSNYPLKNIYLFKNSLVFYQMYQDKDLFINNKIVLNNEEQFKRFFEYLNNWTPKKHNMTAETMVE